MKITLLGTGTSCGVPQIGCSCPVCSSTDVHDKRFRCSALIEAEGKRILIDCGPDFRQQMLTIPFEPLDAVFITHEHYDHVGGLDDLRPYSIFGEVDVYAEQFCIDHLLERIPYCFTPKEKRYPGVPAINLLPIEPHVPVLISQKEEIPVNEKFMDDMLREKRRYILDKRTQEMKQVPDASLPLEIIPIRVMHGKLPIVGFRIGKLAYITDMSTIPDEEFNYLQGVELLIVNGLRHEPHPSHQTFEQAIAFSEKIGAKETYLIHMSHHIKPHAQEDALLPAHVHLAFDGLVLEV
ncbi:MAG: MBL fold metallo-hydrolase [Bacteroidales bacterium]|nr:MBL fold metallo-hydrolase [Bacteroidales bacterium]